jgi:hypothetical protein
MPFSVSTGRIARHGMRCLACSRFTLEADDA